MPKTKEDLVKMSHKDVVNYAASIGLNKEELESLPKNVIIAKIIEQEGQSPSPTAPEKLNEETVLFSSTNQEQISFSGDRLQDLYDHLKNQQKITKGDVDRFNLPHEIKLYADFEINSKDGYVIETPMELGSTPILIINRDKEFCGYFSTQQTGANKYQLLADPSSVKTDRLANFAEADILFFDKSQKQFFAEGGDILNIAIKAIQLPIGIKVCKTEKSEKRLCFDFGTSNTSVGCYSDNGEVEIVDFLNPYDQSSSKIIPTVVYVQDCADRNNIKYLFGFEAKEKESKENYCLSGSIFYEIKRWINSYEQNEEIRDENGRKIEIPRVEIIGSYLKHVLAVAEHQFKKKFDLFHFSAPVKLKGKYIEMFEKIFPDPYNISKEQNCLDEGIAIIYGHIHDEVKYNKINEIDKSPTIEKHGTDKARIMIVDSGGGTTDLASCSYSMEQQGNATQLNIETQFEDCDSNFGGNNLTYRIMQFLKLKLVNYYQKNFVVNELSELLPAGNEILGMIDNIQNVVYEKFEAEYLKAEQVIPTIFNENSLYRNSSDIKRIKTNFYLLWNVAEIIKIEFFKKNDFLLIGFNEADKENGKIKLPKFDVLKLNYILNGAFVEATDLPVLSVSIKDITTLIYGDIYKLLLKLLGSKKDDELLIYHKFKLSGQTCKITLFDELFKEFVPGRKLRKLGSVINRESESISLKLQCLEGSIKYCSDKDYGKIIPNITNRESPLQFSVSCDRNGENELLNDKDINIEVFDPENHSVAKLIIRTDNKAFIASEDYSFSWAEIGETNLSDLFESKINNYKKEILEGKLNDVSGYKRIIAVIPTKDNFGYIVHEIIKKNDKFYRVNEKSYNFEKDLSEVSFFNGKR